MFTPKSVSSETSACPVRRPWNFATIARAGLPGISRGRKKFSVTAAQSVSRKNPARAQYETHSF